MWIVIMLSVEQRRAMLVSGMALATGSSRASNLMHRSIDLIFECRSLVQCTSG
jgi:hypothetical protein